MHLQYLMLEKSAIFMAGNKFGTSSRNRATR
jgi:hypothetical protein